MEKLAEMNSDINALHTELSDIEKQLEAESTPIVEPQLEVVTDNK